MLPAEKISSESLANKHAFALISQFVLDAAETDGSPEECYANPDMMANISNTVCVWHHVGVCLCVVLSGGGHFCVSICICVCYFSPYPAEDALIEFGLAREEELCFVQVLSAFRLCAK